MQEYESCFCDDFEAVDEEPTANQIHKSFNHYSKIMHSSFKNKGHMKFADIVNLTLTKRMSIESDEKFDNEIKTFDINIFSSKNKRTSSICKDECPNYNANTTKSCRNKFQDKSNCKDYSTGEQTKEKRLLKDEISFMLHELSQLHSLKKDNIFEAKRVSILNDKEYESDSCFNKCLLISMKDIYPCDDSSNN